MIQDEKLTAALRAVHATLMAGERLARDRGEADAARFLNEAEYLPGLMLDAADATDDFEQHLRLWAREGVVGQAALNAYNRELGLPEVTREQLDAEPRYRPHPDCDPRGPFPLRWVRVDPDGGTAEVDLEEAFGPERAAEVRRWQDEYDARQAAADAAPALKDAA